METAATAALKMAQVEAVQTIESTELAFRNWDETDLEYRLITQGKTYTQEALSNVFERNHPGLRDKCVAEIEAGAVCNFGTDNRWRRTKGSAVGTIKRAIKAKVGEVESVHCNAVCYDIFLWHIAQGRLIFALPLLKQAGDRSLKTNAEAQEIDDKIQEHMRSGTLHCWQRKFLADAQYAARQALDQSFYMVQHVNGWFLFAQGNPVDPQQGEKLEEALRAVFPERMNAEERFLSDAAAELRNAKVG